MSSGLVITPRIRKSPFFDVARQYGGTDFSVYNKMYMPFGYDTPEAEYRALTNDVTLWDVGAQRMVEITGPDAFRFTDMLTPRDLSKCKVGQCKYVVITDQNGGLLNDCVLLRRGENHFWICHGDNDLRLWARGVAVHAGMDVSVAEPDVSPLQVQGPKSRAVMDTLFGDSVSGLAYYAHADAELNGIPLVVSRTGFTAELGYEVYLMDGTRGTELWEAIMAAGKPHGIVPAAPSRIRRIEAGILDYGVDMNESVNAFEIGLDRLVALDTDRDFIGKAALKRIKAEGITRRIAGIHVEGAPLAYNDSAWDVSRGGQAVGKMTSVIFSPTLETNIAIVMVAMDCLGLGTELEVTTPDGPRRGVVVEMPFVDPNHERARA